MFGHTAKPQVTNEERALADAGQTMWSQRQGIFRPLREKLIQSLTDTASDAARTRGLAATDAAIAAGSRGIQGSSAGAVAAGLGDAATQAGAQRGLSLVNANQAVQGRKVAGLESLVSAGRAQAGQAMSGLADAAAKAQSREMQRVNRINARRQAVIDTVAQLTGNVAATAVGNMTRADMAGGKTGGLSLGGGSGLSSPYQLSGDASAAATMPISLGGI